MNSPQSVKLLVLGGTQDARVLVSRLAAQPNTSRPISMTYSVAGLVRLPDVPCETRVGGFSRLGGLANYLTEHEFTGVLDATHPYAVKMTGTAMQVCRELGLLYWRFQRPAWRPEPGDHWFHSSNWLDLLNAIRNKSRVFFSVGQLGEATLNLIDKICVTSGQKQCVRTAAEPSVPLLPSMSWIKAIGPFNLDEELQLMKRLKIDALVTKNSGGQSTYAKIEAARQLSLPVYMLDRPQLDPLQISQMPSEMSCLSTCVTKILSELAAVESERFVHA